MKFILKGELIITTDSGFKINPRVIELLSLIQKHGSLNVAAKTIGMSYSYAWNTLNKINCQLEKPLVTTHKGGNGGGVTVLTKSGENLISRYRSLQDKFNSFLKEQAISI